MNLEEKIISIIKNNIEDDKEITLSTNIKTDLNIDSFSTLMIITALEDELSVSIQDTDFSKVNTVSDIVRLLRERYPNLGGE